MSAETSNGYSFGGGCGCALMILAAAVLLNLPLVLDALTKIFGCR